VKTAAVVEPSAGAAPAPAPAAGGAAVIDSPAPKKTTVARTEKKPDRPGGGRIELAVAPWGEVLVDGKSRGLSPPLRVLELSSGPHTVEIRNAKFPVYVQKVEVKTGEAVKIQHRFR
jgi:hypothetical protein